MNKYRVISEIVEAQQWWPPGHSDHDPTMLVHRKGNQVDPPDYRQVGDLYLAFQGGLPNVGGEDIFMLRTKHGDFKVVPGDWIIVSPDGKSVCSEDSFKTRYEKLNE